MKPLELLTTRPGRFPRFLVAGGFATLVHWLAMLVLIKVGVLPVLATAIGATAGLLVNYMAQYRYTFRSELAHPVAFPRYLAGAGLGWALNLIVFALLQAAGAGITLSQALATGMVAVLNYLLAERFVFHEEPKIDVQ